MSINYCNLCSVVIKQCFGETVQKVSDCLFSALSRNLLTIIKSTGLTRKEVINALAVLIKFQLVTFKPSDVNPTIAEYSLKQEAILYILRYSRYVHLAQTKYEKTGASIVEILLQSGTQTGTNVVLNCFSSRQNEKKLEDIRNVFSNMICDNYIMKLPKLMERDEKDPIPKFSTDLYDVFILPEIDLNILQQLHAGKTDVKPKDADIHWQINFARFHQDFRDTAMLSAVERKLGATAAECFSYILKEMYTWTDPWKQQSSNPVSFIDIKLAIEKSSNNIDLMKYLDQYVALIADDSLGFLQRFGEMRGGQYVVQMEHILQELSLVCIEHIITERFGSKASRIFRVIRTKKFIEQEEIQKEAMIPAKEAKLLVYNLFQEQFIQIKTIRKPGGGGSGPAKAFHLFHVKQKHVVKMLLDFCYKALYNAITRSNYEKKEKRRLIEKAQKLESIIATMKERGESSEYITEIAETLTPPEREILDKIKARIKTLSSAELNLDDTIFLFQMYLFHSSSPGNSKTK